MNLLHIHNLHRAIILSAFILLVGLLPPFAVSSFAANGDSSPPAVAPGSFPGLQDVVPRASQLTDDLAQMTSGITANVNIDSLTKRSEKLVKDWQTFSEQVQSYGELDSWPANRLLQAQTQVEQHNRDFSKTLDMVSEPLSVFEDVRVIWTSRKQYWADWEKALKATGAKVPRNTFRQVDEVIAKALSETKNTVNQLVQLQLSISKDRDGLLTLRDQLNIELADLRRDPLKRNAHRLFSKEFAAQFGPELRSKAVEGIKATLQFPGDFFSRQGWLLAIQAALVLILFGIFRILEKATAERAEQWGFVFSRPIAAALFLASTIPQIFYVAPPPLLLLIMTAVSIFSASRLAAALLPHKTERSYVYLLAAIHIFTGALYVTGLPLPYHRLYLALLSLIGAPALLLTARRYFRREDRRDSVGITMFLGAVILFTVLTAEITGYMTFASWLIDATFGTILLTLFVVMLLHIVEGGIEVIFTMQKISSKQFVKQLGKKAPQRFKNLFRIILIVSAMNYLFAIWGVAEGFENVWNTILGLKFSIGEFSLSLHMIFLVLLMLYLTILLSWIVQSFIESQIFYQKRIDRGVRDAVKKLTHYALMLIGFLVAMSMAGIDLKNLTILFGAFGIGIGFGLQGIVNNFISGLILLFERPVKVGDTIVVGDTTGVIISIGMRSTVVETWDRSEIIVPNSQIISEKVTNWTLSSSVARVVLPVGVKYGTDMQKVITLLESVAAENELVIEDPQPSAVFIAFGDSSIDFQLRAWIENVENRLKVRSELGVAIDNAFRKHSIEIPFPQQDLHLRSVEPGIMGVGKKKPETKKPTPRKKAVPAEKPKEE